MFSNKTLLITGGTGSLGSAVLARFLNTNIKEIRIFSRDEKKQEDLRKKYSSNKLKFYLGDIRDLGSIDIACRNVDYVFHAAALKQVPSCEFYPIEAVKTNVIGTDNLLEAAYRNDIKKVICLSTDKAVFPVNAMGMSKALMEKVMIAKSRQFDDSVLTVCGTRYGNVMASRGSVIPLFISQILNDQPITITIPEMTRFVMSMDEAVDLVLYAFKNGKNGDIFIRKAPAASMVTLVSAIKRLLNRTSHEVKYIGARHGEKIHEVLLTESELSSAEDLGDYFKIPRDNRGLNYSDAIRKNVNNHTSENYSSSNTHQLTIDEMSEILRELPNLMN